MMYLIYTIQRQYLQIREETENVKMQYVGYPLNYLGYYQTKMVVTYMSAWHLLLLNLIAKN